MTRGRWLGGVLLVLSCAAAAWAARTPSGVLHTPPTSAHMGDPVPLEVTVDGVPDGEPKVEVFYRAQGTSRFDSMELEPNGTRTYTGEISGPATRGLSLNYFIEVTGPGNTYRTRIGSRGQPLSVLLLEPTSSKTADRTLQFALSVLSIAMVAGIVVLRDRSRRKVTMDRVFWMKTLGPAVKLRGEGASKYVALLAEREIEHPTLGKKTYSTKEILRKLEEIRALDPGELQRARDRFLGAQYELPDSKPRGAVGEVRSRLRAVAARVGRLCAAAWLISRARRGTGTPQRDFLKPFEAARRAVRQVQKALESGQVDEAQALLHAVDQQASEMNRQVAEADQSCPAENLERCLTSMASVTADMLGRLVEYYALVAAHSATTRDKMIVVATEMARRDSLRGDAPGRIQAALRRRDVMQDQTVAAPDATVTKQAEELRLLLSVEDPSEEVLDKLRSVIEQFKNDLGEAVYSVEGLSYVVSLELLLGEKGTSLERSEAGEFDSVAQDLDRVVEKDTTRLAAADSVEADDDPTALELLRVTEEEFRTSRQRGDLQEKGFFLEAFEQETLESEAKDPVLASLVTRAVACLAAMNRVARSHSKAGQPDGVEPPPVPRPLAVTLVRRGADLYRDLQDLSEKELMQGQYLRAKECNRFMHRLHRTRIGLALLAKLPVEG